MTTPVWPATLPQAPLVDSWTGGPQRNKVSFKPEIGPPIVRRRGTSRVVIWEGTFPPFSADQLDDFEEFFATDLKDGTLAFNWTDPVHGDTGLWTFSDDDPPYKVSAGAASLYNLSMKLIRIS